MKSNCAAAQPQLRRIHYPALSDIQRERTTYKISATTKAAGEAGTTTGGMNRFRQLAIIIAGGDS